MKNFSPPPLRIIFAGTPDFSVSALQALLDSEHEVIAVYTQPDRPAGRGRKLTASPVKTLALAHQLPIIQPESLKTAEAQQTLMDLNADLMVVVAYGLLLPKAVLDAPSYGCLNIHASLLPRWRGAAPIQRAIEAGDAQTGVTIMQMDIGLDTGNMLFKITTDITAEDNAASLHDRLSQLGAIALMETLVQLQTQQLKPEQQDESLVTYAKKLSKAEAEIQWNELADRLVRKIQAFNPWPVAFTHFQDSPLRVGQARLLSAEEAQAYQGGGRNFGTVLAIEKSGVVVATGSTPILIQQVQPSGKKMMSAYDFAQSRSLLGHRFL
ncbi:Methionyl-tRNA formyltransferase [hydrothermal vent metagenome]|uniref:methionyl-tRNA formyltransferase n=1 Tax=hydrothermal vent metagenome TaxID=652676 RepID=A0A3B0WAL4_9ZZZZ